MRKGAVGLNKQELSADVRAALLAKWREVMLPATGKASGRVPPQESGSSSSMPGRLWLFIVAASPA